MPIVMIWSNLQKKLKELKEDNNAFQEYNIKELNEVKSIQDMKIKLID